MRNIYLTESQIKLLNETIDLEKKTFSPSIYDEIDDAGFDFMDTKIINRMLTERYNEVLDYFSDDITKIPLEKVKNKFNKLLTVCIDKEKNIRPQLEKLCYNVIVDTFGVPEDEVDFSFELKDSIDSGKQFHVSPNLNILDGEYDSVDDIYNENSEIKKRKIVNLLVQGGATRVFNAVRNKYLSEVFDLDEDLPRLYSKLIKINDYIMFSEKSKIDDKHTNQSGFCEVILGNSEKKSRINVEGVVFPILLYEAIKGLFELFGTHCLPVDDMKLMKEVMDNADTLKLEPMNMRIGPILWDYIFDDVDSRILPYMFNRLITVSTDKFNKYIEEIEYKTKVGKEIVQELKSSTDYAYQYEKFKDDLMKKKDDIDMITDSYYYNC